MRHLPNDFSSHLNSGVTTLCTCWKLTRADGNVFGFTDHDQTLSFGGLDYEPEGGFTAKEATQSLGLSIDAAEIDGALRSDRISETDLRAGLFDAAQIEVLRVNWRDTSQTIVLRRGALGPVKFQGNQFSTSVHGLADSLQSPTGRIYQAGCDAELGDNRCTVDLSDPSRQATVSIIVDEGLGILKVSGLAAFSDTTFNCGEFEISSGRLNGAKFRIRTHTRYGAGDRLHLWTTPPEPLDAGVTAIATVGCDKRFDTCRVKFSNQHNFRGFPHMPGNSFVFGYARQGSPKNTGGSMQ